MSANTVDWKGRLGPMALWVPESTFRPSTLSRVLADVLEISPGDVVIDVGCGSGILAIIAARLGASQVHATDTSPDVVEVGSANAKEQGVADTVTFYRGDLFEAIPDDVVADVIIGDVSGIPDKLADKSGWFPSKSGGGPRGSELPIRMLGEAKRHLRPGGRVFLPTGSIQDEDAIIEAARSLYAKCTQIGERRVPLPSKIAESEVVQDLMESGIVTLIPRGSRLLWEIRIWELSVSA